MALILSNAGGSSKTIKYKVYDSLSDTHVHNSWTAYDGDELYDKTNIKLTVVKGSLNGGYLMTLNTSTKFLLVILLHLIHRFRYQLQC